MSAESDCHRYGISGRCGPDTCPAYKIYKECGYLENETMDAQQLTQGIFNTTESLKAAIDNAADAVEMVITCKKTLAAAKVAAFDAGKIDGKNEDIRKAQYAEVCKFEMDEVEMAEKAQRRTQATLEIMRLNYEMSYAVLRIHEYNAAE